MKFNEFAVTFTIDTAIMDNLWREKFLTQCECTSAAHIVESRKRPAINRNQPHLFILHLGESSAAGWSLMPAIHEKFVGIYTMSVFKYY